MVSLKEPNVYNPSSHWGRTSREWRSLFLVDLHELEQNANRTCKQKNLRRLENENNDTGSHISLYIYITDRHCRMSRSSYVLKGASRHRAPVTFNKCDLRCNFGHQAAGRNQGPLQG